MISDSIEQNSHLSLHLDLSPQENTKIFGASCKSVASFVVSANSYCLWTSSGRRALASLTDSISTRGIPVYIDAVRQNSDFILRTFKADGYILNPYSPDFADVCANAEISAQKIFAYINARHPLIFESGVKKFLSLHKNISVYFKYIPPYAFEIRRALAPLVLAEPSVISPDIKDVFNPDGSGAEIVMSCAKALKNSDDIQSDIIKFVNRTNRAIDKTLYRKSTVITI